MSASPTLAPRSLTPHARPTLTDAPRSLTDPGCCGAVQEGCGSRDDELAALREFVADPAKLPAAEALLAMIKKHSPRAAPTEDEILAELPPSHLDHLLTAEEASEFEKDGFLILPGALPPAKAREMQETFDDLESTFRPKLDLNIHERLNLLDCLALDERLLELTDWAATFPKVWGLMGWHISLYIAQCTAYPATAERGEPEMTRAQRQRPETGSAGAPPPKSTHIWHRVSSCLVCQLRSRLTLAPLLPGLGQVLLAPAGRGRPGQRPRASREPQGGLRALRDGRAHRGKMVILSRFVAAISLILKCHCSSCNSSRAHIWARAWSAV